MKYAIMLALVIGLASADFITGVIKAFANNDLKSYKMRVGGVKKLGEIVVALTAIGCDIGISKLTAYYPDTKLLGDILGNYTAIVVVSYIALMEIISIMENFAAINTEARWAKALAKKLANIERVELKKLEEGDQNDKDRDGRA